ncbi:MAG: methyltransferase domain-containing protein [Bacteroidaceae bacterium]|nr:methyltransferase domain-containing protein [Bacteroidaceae bacterium]
MYSVYVANLAKRTDRKESVEVQFKGRSEFALEVVPAISHKTGAYGLWKTFCGIVRQEEAKGSECFIFCEDDHVFTDAYHTAFLEKCITQAASLGADLLSGGMSWVYSPVQVSDNLFAVDAFTGMQFTVVFRRMYSKILLFADRDCVTDIFLSEIAERMFVTYPFISVQDDFGYSDATGKNNEDGRVPWLFQTTASRLRRLHKVHGYYKNLDATRLQLPDLQNVSLSTYVIHLPEREERLKSARKQFEERPEFSVTYFDACRDKVGAVGLWKSICAIVREARDKGEDAVLICEDDHVFTPAYDTERFLGQVWQAGAWGTQILLGGIGGFGDLVPVKNDLYWADWLWCTQFLVVYKRAYATILSAEFTEKDVADEFLSRLLPNKLVVYPFISIQQDFGYSDVTRGNNVRGSITAFFNKSERRARPYRRLAMQYAAPEPAGGFVSTSKDFSGLHLGCGDNLLGQGWVDTDIKPANDKVRFLDATQPFPYTDGTFDAIFSEHLFEHLSYEGGKSMLRECYRTLKPGGVIRITLPTMDFLKRLLADPQDARNRRYVRWSLQHYAARMYADLAELGEAELATLVVNNFIRLWGHRMVYCTATLERMLADAGFTHYTRSRAA